MRGRERRVGERGRERRVGEERREEREEGKRDLEWVRRGTKLMLSMSIIPNKFKQTTHKVPTGLLVCQ